jgi:hypothetical protein
MSRGIMKYVQEGSIQVKHTGKQNPQAQGVCCNNVKGRASASRGERKGKQVLVDFSLLVLFILSQLQPFQ